MPVICLCNRLQSCNSRKKITLLTRHFHRGCNGLYFAAVTLIQLSSRSKCDFFFTSAAQFVRFLQLFLIWRFLNVSVIDQQQTG
jgi:hypothetical protein